MALDLSEKGYEIWADNMTPYLNALLQGNADATTWQALKSGPKAQ
jgi:hypothetical protein